MKRFLSVLLAVVMVVAMLPAGIAFAADGNNTDIVFDFVAAANAATAGGVAYAGSGYSTATFASDSTLVSYMPEGISVNHTIGQTAANLRWQKNAAIRFCNHASTWEAWSEYKASGDTFVLSNSSAAATQNNRLAFDITISADQAGWYRPNVTFASYYTGALYSVYVISGSEVKFVGEISTASSGDMNPIYLGEGTHTLFFGSRYPELTAAASESGYMVKNASPTSFIANITLKAVNTTPVVNADSVTAPATLNVGTTGTVDASNLTVSDSVGTYDLAIFAADAATGKSLGESTVDYIKVTSSNEYVATVAKTTATTSTITPLHEGTTTLTITPVVGGVEQTAMAATKTVTVTDPTNVLFDFYNFTKLYVCASATDTSKPIAMHAKVTSTPLLAGFSVNRTGTADNDGPIWQPSSGVRFRLGHGDWQKVDRGPGTDEESTTYNNKVVFNVEVGTGKAGWYTPSIKFSANNESNTTVNPTPTFSVYHIYNGEAAFLGDAPTGTTSLNPVYLEEGTNQIVLATVHAATISAYLNELNFTKRASEPSFAAPAVADLPETVLIDEVAEATVTISADDALYQLEEVGIDTATFLSKAERETYIEITSSGDGIVEVTEATVSGANNKTTASFSVTGLKAGTTDLTFTPVINGEKMTDLTTTKTVKVKAWDLQYDFEPIFANEVAEADYATGRTDMSVTFSAKPELESLMPEGITLSDINMPDTLMCWNNQALRFCNHGTTWTSNGANSVLAFDIELGADNAGWYRPNVQMANGFPNAQQFYVYALRADGSVKYLGDLVSNGRRLNPVYLGEGTHTIALGCHYASSLPTTYVMEVNLYRYENAPTMSTFTANIPTALTLGSTGGTITAESATMSDSGSFEYGKYTMDEDGRAQFDASSTDDYILVESDDTSVATVARRGADTWNITPVAEGTTTITVTPYYNGVAQTALVQTKTVTVTYPNESVDYAPNFIVNAVVGEEGFVAEAQALIKAGDLTIGSIGALELGSEITLTAESNDDLKFLYWYNGNSKKILSDEEEYTFKVGTKAAIYAKYARTNDELTEYASAAGQLVGETEGAFAAEPDLSFDTYYKLFKDTTVPSYESILVTKTATSPNFVAWKKANQIVSYNSEYSFYTWPNAEEATEVTTATATDIPSVVLFSSGTSHMLELVNFEGIEIIEKGILFAESGTPTVNNFGAKAVSVDLSATQFTASSDASVARAYVIYLDGAEYRVAYSD